MKLWFEGRKEGYVGHQPEIVGLLFRELQIATFGFHQLKVYITRRSKMRQPILKIQLVRLEVMETFFWSA